MRSGRNRSALAGILFLLAAVCAGAEEAGTITPDQLAERMESGKAPLVLDVRTVQEFGRGHIPGAVNIPHNKLKSRVDEIAEYRESDVVVHCRLGRRAKVAEGVLREAGFTNVLDLEGHWLGWRSAGHLMEKGSGQPDGAQVGESK